MVFESIVTGKVVDVKLTKKGKKMIFIYDKNSSRVAGVFVNGEKDYQVMEDVEIPVKVITDDYYCVEMR